MSVSFTVDLPESDEDLGRFLERNNARIEISCTMGTYEICVTYHRLRSYEESGRVSVRHSSDLVVIGDGKTFSEALARALSAKPNEVRP